MQAVESLLSFSNLEPNDGDSTPKTEGQPLKKEVSWVIGSYIQVSPLILPTARTKVQCWSITSERREWRELTPLFWWWFSEQWKKGPKRLFSFFLWGGWNTIPVIWWSCHIPLFFWIQVKQPGWLKGKSLAIFFGGKTVTLFWKGHFLTSRSNGQMASPGAAFDRHLQWTHLMGCDSSLFVWLRNGFSNFCGFLCPNVLACQVT